MAYGVFGVSSDKRRKAMLHAGTAVLAIAVWLPAPARAADYTAFDQTSLNSAIDAANTDGAPSSTITLSNDVSMTAPLLDTATKDVTINSGAFTFTRAFSTGSPSNGVLEVAGGTGTVTLKGTITGGAGNGNNPGMVGLFVSGATVINDSTVTAGLGSGTGTGGTGFATLGAVNFTNNGTIAGTSATGGGNGGNGGLLQNGAIVTNNAGGSIIAGNGVNGGVGLSASVGLTVATITNSGIVKGGNGTTGAGGIGINATRGSTITNNAGGTITGGDGATGGNGITVAGQATILGSVTNSGTITGGNGTAGNGGHGISAANFVALISNSGTIQGGTSATGTGGYGVNFTPGAHSLTNDGTIHGGDGVVGGVGILFAATGTGNTIVNSGTIQGGNGSGTGVGISVHAGLASLTNTGTIAGGDGAFAIVNAVSAPINMINSGAITAGAGQAVAIQMLAGGDLTLELHKGSVITGTVLGVTGSANSLILGGDDDASFDASAIGPQYQNFNLFQKTGASTWTLSGTTAVAGPWAVNAGKLSVNGSMANATITVASGGTLGGNGTVGATTIQSGGAIAPGNSIGTLHINGAFAQGAGSIYQVEVDPASSASDLILVNGAATIAGGAAINVTKNPPGNYRLDAQYTVLTASGGVTGNYTAGGDTAVSQFLALRPTTDANNVYLRIVQTGDPASVATTPNQQQTATGTDSLPGTNTVGTAVLNTPDAPTARAGFDALSGEALASAKGVLISSSVLVRDTTFDRLRDVVCTDSAQDQHRRAGCVAAGDRPSLWVQGFGDWGHTFGNANAAGVSQTTGGFLAGVDVPVSDWRLGVFGGYSRTDFNVATRASSGASDTYHLGAYGGTMIGDVGLRLGASYSWSGIDTERLVAFDTFTNDLRASYNAGTTQVFGEIGRAFQADRISLEPFANLAYVGIYTRGFSETGGDAALTSRPDTTQDMFATFGVRPSMDITIGSISAVLRGMAGWRHTFGDVTPSSLVSFGGSTAFTVTGAPIAKEAGVVEAGVSANLSDRAAIALTYGGQFSDRETDHGIRGTISITF